MKLDDFEAVFRSAVKDRYRFSAPSVDSILVITDLPRDEAAEVEACVRRFLGKLRIPPTQWTTIGASDFSSVRDVVARIDQVGPDLIVCYRHLLGRIKQLNHSLGSVVDTITQATTPPVLLLPYPICQQAATPPTRVMVIADHLQGDDQLVNWGVHLCPDQGTLYLAHIEDDKIYERYMETIAMVPDIDTKTTQIRVAEKLLSRPRGYIQSIAEMLKEQGIQESVVPIIEMGHALVDYRRIMNDNNIELAIFHTKDEDQLAMHGMAYAISIEIQDRPLLLL